MEINLNQLKYTKGENMENYATQIVEKQLDVVKELLMNNEINQAEAAE
jgi:hypothetical protein